MKKKTLTEKFRENPWILSTIVLLILVIVLLFFNCGIISLNDNEVMSKEEIVDKLIENNISFVYSSLCPHCQRQIEFFGDNFQEYEDSGLTIDCIKNPSDLCGVIEGTPAWIKINETGRYLAYGYKEVFIF